MAYAASEVLTATMFSFFRFDFRAATQNDRHYPFLPGLFQPGLVLSARVVSSVLATCVSQQLVSSPDSVPLDQPATQEPTDVKVQFFFPFDRALVPE